MSNLSKHVKSCPGSCKGTEGEGRQRILTQNETKKITGPALEVVTKNPDNSLRCAYCAAVYVSHASKELLGYLDCAILGEGWHPVGKYKTI